MFIHLQYNNVCYLQLVKSKAARTFPLSSVCSHRNVQADGWFERSLALRDLHLQVVGATQKRAV